MSVVHTAEPEHKEVRNGSVQGPHHQRRHVQQARGAALAKSVRAASEGPSLRHSRRQRRDGAEISETEIGDGAEGRAYDRSLSARAVLAEALGAERAD